MTCSCLRGVSGWFTPLACGPGSPELSKSYMHMAIVNYLHVYIYNRHSNRQHPISITHHDIWLEGWLGGTFVPVQCRHIIQSSSALCQQLLSESWQAHSQIWACACREQV